MKTFKKIPHYDTKNMSSKQAFEYAEIHGRTSELEDIIATDAKYAYMYARDILACEFVKGEKIIATSAMYSYRYAHYILNARFPIGEKMIATDPAYSYWYASEVLDGRFYEGESIILNNSSIVGSCPKNNSSEVDNSFCAYQYAKKVLGRRWLKAEPTIRKSGYWQYYKEYFNIK